MLHDSIYTTISRARDMDDKQARMTATSGWYISVCTTALNKARGEGYLVLPHIPLLVHYWNLNLEPKPKKKEKNVVSVDLNMIRNSYKSTQPKFINSRIECD